MECRRAILILLLFAVPTQAAIQLHYLHNDHLGTPRVVTNEARQIVWKGQLKPFGETRVEVEAITNHRRFPGQRLEFESRLHYNYFRDYDPTTGRYLQSDPIGILKNFSDPQLQIAIQKMHMDIMNDDGGASHSYSYASSNPFSFIDFYGLFGNTVQGAPSGGHGPMGGMGQSLGDTLSGPNGNMWGQPGPQDNVCTLGPVFGPIGDACVPERCRKHDDCYATNDCTASSWASSALGGTKSCNQCNSGFF